MTIPANWRQGLRKPNSAGIASCIAANSGVLLHALSAGRTGIVRKLHIMNRTAGQVTVSLGVGLLGAFVASLPGFVVPSGMDLELVEADLVPLEFTANITVASSAAGAAPLDVQVSGEVEEIQGPTG